MLFGEVPGGVAAGTDVDGACGGYGAPPPAATVTALYLAVGILAASIRPGVAATAPDTTAAAGPIGPTGPRRWAPRRSQSAPLP